MASLDLDALSAREIKERLAAARVDFSDCFEKQELVKRLREHFRALDVDKVQEVKALANRSDAKRASTPLTAKIGCGLCERASLKQALHW